VTARLTARELSAEELIETLDNVTAARLTFSDPDPTGKKIGLNLLDAAVDACLWNLMKLAEKGDLKAADHLRRINPTKTDTAVSDAVH
jgi:hypothetical protein